MENPEDQEPDNGISDNRRPRGSENRIAEARNTDSTTTVTVGGGVVIY